MNRKHSEIIGKQKLSYLKIHSIEHAKERQKINDEL